MKFSRGQFCYRSVHWAPQIRDVLEGGPEETASAARTFGWRTCHMLGTCRVGVQFGGP